MKDIVGEYAQLAVMKEIYDAKGKRPPSDLVRRMQVIETTARARLTPQQFQAALHHVEQAKLHFNHEMQAQAQAREAAEAQAFADRATRDLTSGVVGQSRGLTRAQLSAVAAGRPLPAGPAKLTQAQRDAVFRDRTRAMDPAGKGWGEAEYERRMDALADATPEQFNKIASGYRAHPEQLRTAVRQWKGDRIEYGLMKRRQASDRFHGLEGERTREPNERDRRRATLVSAYLNQSADKIEEDTYRGRDSETLREVGDTRYRELISETEPDGRPSRRAYIAAAMAESENEGGLE